MLWYPERLHISEDCNKVVSLGSIYDISYT